MASPPSRKSRDALAATGRRMARAFGSRSQVRANDASTAEAHSRPDEPECVHADEPSAADQPFVFTAAGVLAIETRLLSLLRSYLRQCRQLEDDPESPGPPHLFHVEQALQRVIHRAFVQERLQAPGDLHTQQLEEIVKLKFHVEAMSRRLSDREEEIVRLRSLSRATPQEPARTPPVTESREIWPEAGPEKTAALAQMLEDNLKLRAQFARPT